MLYAPLIIALLFSGNAPVGDNTGSREISPNVELPAALKVGFGPPLVYHSFWDAFSSWVLSLHQQRNFLQELIGSATSRFGVVQIVYATTHTITANGNAKIDTSQSEFGGASGKFDGTNSYLSTPDSTDFNINTGDFTTDFWVRFNALPTLGNYMMVASKYASGSSRWYVALQNSSGIYKWVFSGVSGIPTVTNTWSSPAAGTWYHFGVVRSGNSFLMFVNGFQIGSTQTSSASIGNPTANFEIGRWAAPGYYFNGWLDEYRFSKVARWTNNFTPSSSPYSNDSNTVLLLHMDGTNGSTTFVDSSGGPDFTTTPSPASQSVTAGNTASYTISLTGSTGYSGTVALTLSSGTPCPSGATCTFSPSAPVSVTTSTTTVTFSVQTSSSGFTGTTSLTVSATDGTNTHTATVSLTVTAPVGPDFSITSSPTSQSVGAGTSVSYTLSITASGGYTGTLTSLTVTSGCPSGVSCTVTPNSSIAVPGTATLSVPTLITTTSGPYSIVVTGTDGTITHTVTVSLTVSGPQSFQFNVKATATQIVVTLSFTWSGTGTPPVGSITIAGPSGNPTLSESGGVVYDRISVAVSGGTNTYTVIHRVTFTSTAPGSQQVWTAYVSLSGISSYNITIEVY